MFEGIRARWAAARNARLAQTVDLQEGEVVLQAGVTQDPRGALFVTDRRVVLHDYGRKHELSVPWGRVEHAELDDRGRTTWLVLSLDAPQDQPEELTALVPTEIVPALLEALHTRGASA